MRNNAVVGRDRDKESARLSTALYIRLSREDEEGVESLSVSGQRLLLTEFINGRGDLRLYDTYIDDGYTGTNVNRPGFQRMLRDIEDKKVQCVVVKDLSRLGRNMPEVSRYINEYFPEKRVRFIAVNDEVDKGYSDMDTDADLMIDFKNLFNGFYPRDISKKVRSTFRSKQNSGQFIGAFAGFGYVKSPENHNKLEIDEYAAAIVRRIFDMYIGGTGQNTIAKILNEEKVPCPSEYKRQCGLKYRNGNRLGTTSYWTYAAIRNILRNEYYIGNTVQNKSFRQMGKKKAVNLPRENWIIVENTHEPIIDRDTWDKVQHLLECNTRQTNFTENIHLFAGCLRCGDCGRAMVKIRRRDANVFNCGSYNRYGKKICTSHSITERELEEIVLHDLNRIISAAENRDRLIEEETKKAKKDSTDLRENMPALQAEINRLIQKKESAYEDYSDGLITKEEYIKYRDKYEQKIAVLRLKMDKSDRTGSRLFAENQWMKDLRQGKLHHLDRETVVEMVSTIYIYEDHTVKMVYYFSDTM